MLTPDDLKAIRKIMREEIGNEIKVAKQDITGEMSLSRMRIQNEISDLTDRIKNLEIRLRKDDEEDDDLFENI